MLHEEKIISNKVAFCAKLQKIANNLGVSADWLMQIMWFESGLNPAQINSISGAIGLIQFMPATAKALGTTSKALAAMNNVEQLDYVYKYLVQYKNKLNSFIDVYFAVFFPAAIGKPLDWILEAKNLSRSKIAEQNPVFDTNRDHILTVGEVQAVMLTRVPSSFRDLFKKKV